MEAYNEKEDIYYTRIDDESWHHRRIFFEDNGRSIYDKKVFMIDKIWSV